MGIEDEVRDILSVSRAAALVGPRQAGKSTLAKQLQLAGLVSQYFSLDSEQRRRSALADPDGFALSLPRPARHRRGSARTGGLVNYAALGRELALDDKTIKAHIELLAQLFLLYKLRPWSTNLGSRQIKTPKLFLSDSGMAAALLGADETRYSAPDEGALAGMLFETFVLMEIVKQATWSNARVEPYFYRDTEKREVDLLLEGEASNTQNGCG